MRNRLFYGLVWKIKWRQVCILPGHNVTPSHLSATVRWTGVVNTSEGWHTTVSICPSFKDSANDCLLFQLFSAQHGHTPFIIRSLFCLLMRRNSRGCERSAGGRESLQEWSAQQLIEAQSALAFPAELIILMRQCPNSSRINLSTSAWGWWVCSAFLACSSKHSHVASSTSFVTNVYGILWRNKNKALGRQYPADNFVTW